MSVKDDQQPATTHTHWFSQAQHDTEIHSGLHSQLGRRATERDRGQRQEGKDERQSQTRPDGEGGGVEHAENGEMTNDV